MMRQWIALFENTNEFALLAQQCSTWDEFIRRTDGRDVLYRGHSGEVAEHHVFMTDYHGHAANYGDTVDAFAYNPQDVLFFNDQRFQDMRYRLNRLMPAELLARYRSACQDNRFADQFSYAEVRRVIRSDTPYEELAGNPQINDAIVPLMQQWASEKGYNIIAFVGNDYADYGGHNEYVVGDVTRLVDLRRVFEQNRSA